jgi:hypothetical protein
MFRQGMETFETAMKTAARIQEESARRFTELLQEMGSPAQWQKRFQSVMGEAVVMTQKNFDEAIHVMSQNAKSTLELFQKALETPMPQGSDTEGKYRGLWESALTTLRKNTETILQANTRVTESWADLAKKVSGQAEDTMAGSGENHQ